MKNEEKQRYLIGPENFYSYLIVLQIVFIAIFIGISISTIISGIFAEQGTILKVFVTYIGTLFMAQMQGFAWVTIAFAVAEWNGKTIPRPFSNDSFWLLSQLHEKDPSKKRARISRTEAIFGIIFSTVFFYILYNNPEIIAIYWRGTDGTTIVPLINAGTLEAYKSTLIIIYILNILKEALKIIIGKWGIRLSIIVSVLSTVSMALSLFIFTRPNLFNPNFAEEVSRFVNLNFNYLRVVIIVIVVGTIIEVVQNLYRGFKYDKVSL